MKAVIVTQEEPFYLPLCIGEILKLLRQKIAAIIILPGIPNGFNYFSYIKRLYDIFGFLAFVSYGLLFIKHHLYDRFDFSSQPMRYHSVKKAALKNKVPLYYLDNINAPASVNLLKMVEPDVIISIAASQIFKNEILNLAKHIINVHGALLPRYQGMMPGFWVLAKGEKTTGVTAHFMTEKVDIGPIILQKEIEITPQETLHSIQTKIAKTGAEVVIEALNRLEEEKYQFIYPDLQKGCYFSFPTKEAAREFRRRGRRFI